MNYRTLPVGYRYAGVMDFVRSKKLLRIVAFAEPLFGASIVAAGALRGAGDSKAPFLLSLATMWGVRITLSFALAGSMGLQGVWLAMTIELVARGLVFMARMYRG